MNLKNYYENLSVFHCGTEPNRSYYIPCTEKVPFGTLNMKKHSDRIIMLNGDWNFHLFNSVGLVPDEIVCEKYWSGNSEKISVPSVWQYKGYDKNQYINVQYEEQNMTTFATAEMLDAATVWTDFYTKYKFPKTYNFFNRFRTGTIPLAIQDYTQYATISAAAPEISGRWTMVQIPGFLEEDGSINNTVSGSGNAAVPPP